MLINPSPTSMIVADLHIIGIAVGWKPLGLSGGI
jgi:hypothetical protein